MVYLRARFYAPELNRFSQKDLIRGSVTQPGSLNRYLYVQNDPVNYIDPSGMRPIEGATLNERSSNSTSSGSASRSASSASSSVYVPPVQPYNIRQATTNAVAEARRAAELANKVAPGSPAAYRATQAYYETQRLAAQANASRNTQAARQAAQTAQASSSYVNNVAAGRAPNTYSPYDSNGNVYSYYNSSYDTGKIPSPDSPRVKDVDPGNVEYCEGKESWIERFKNFQIWHIDSKAEMFTYSAITLIVDGLGYLLTIGAVSGSIAGMPFTGGASAVTAVISLEFLAAAGTDLAYDVASITHYSAEFDRRGEIDVNGLGVFAPSIAVDAFFEAVERRRK